MRESPRGKLKPVLPRQKLVPSVQSRHADVLEPAGSGDVTNVRLEALLRGFVQSLFRA